MRLALVLAGLALAGCGYAAPSEVDRSAPAYRADLGKCEDTAASDVNKQNAKTGLAWFASPVRRWGQIGDAVQSCMADKGYGRLRWCTPEELRSGNGVATAAGLKCEEPPPKKAS